MESSMKVQVQIQGEFNNTVITQIDTGQLKGPAFTGEGKNCFIRTNKPNGVKYRNVSINQNQKGE